MCHVIDVRRLHISHCTHMTHMIYHSYLLHVSYCFKCDWAHGMFFKKTAHTLNETVVFIQRLPGRRRPWSKRCRSSAPWSYMKFRGNLAEKKRRMKKSADNSVEILWTKRGFEPFCFMRKKQALLMAKRRNFSKQFEASPFFWRNFCFNPCQ